MSIDHSKHIEPESASDIALQSSFRFGLALLKLLMIVVLLGWFFSGVYEVDEDETAVEYFLGQIRPYQDSAVRKQGIYFGLPFPLTEVIKIKTKKEISVVLHVIPNMVDNKNGDVNADPVIQGQWPYAVTKDKSLIQLGWSLTYRISELDLFLKHLYEKSDINKGAYDKPWEENFKNLLEAALLGIITEEASKRTAIEMLTSKVDLRNITRSRLQNELDAIECGVEITSLALVQANPPVSVSHSFWEVFNAEENKKKLIAKSLKEKEEIIRSIEAETNLVHLQVSNEVSEMKASIKADAKQLENLISLFDGKSELKEAFKRQLYWKTISHILQSSEVEYVENTKRLRYKTDGFKNPMEKKKIDKKGDAK